MCEREERKRKVFTGQGALEFTVHWAKHRRAPCRRAATARASQDAPGRARGVSCRSGPPDASRTLAGPRQEGSRRQRAACRHPQPSPRHATRKTRAPTQPAESGPAPRGCPLCLLPRLPPRRRDRRGARPGSLPGGCP